MVTQYRTSGLQCTWDWSSDFSFFRKCNFVKNTPQSLLSFTKIFLLLLLKTRLMSLTPFSLLVSTLQLLPSQPPLLLLLLPPALLCSTDNVLHLILNSPLNTASGPDDISAQMLHNTALSIALPLSLIFNSSISSCSFPTDWKNAFIVSVPKSTSNPPSPKNFRPISLLPIVSKIFERHVFNFLYDFCLSNNLLSNSQYGFCPGFSTETALISVVNSWFSALDTHKSAVCAVFFDLSKPLILFLTNPFLTLCPLSTFLLIYYCGLIVTFPIALNKLL